MRLLVVANNVSHVKELASRNIDIMVSSKFSNYRDTFSIIEIKESLKYSNIFVSFFDLIINQKIDELENYIDELIKIGVKKFVVNDLGVTYYLRKYDVEVILDNITLNTNYESINCYEDTNISGVVLSREITIDEIIEISNNSKLELSIFVQGIFPIFTSIRSLISNYYLDNNNSYKSEIILKDKQRQVEYYTHENEFGTYMFSSFEQCSIEEIKYFEKMKYLIIDQVGINNDANLLVVDQYLEAIAGVAKTIDDIIPYTNNRLSKGFSFKKTMYKL